MLLKTQVSEKKAVSHMKKKLVTIFSRFIECDIPQETIFQALWGILTYIVKL